MNFSVIKMMKRYTYTERRTTKQHHKKQKTSTMETKQLEEQAKKVITQALGIEEKVCTPETRFIEDLGADTIDMVHLIIKLEEEFGIIILDKDASSIKTVGEMITCVEKYV